MHKLKVILKETGWDVAGAAVLLLASIGEIIDTIESGSLGTHHALFLFASAQILKAVFEMREIYVDLRDKKRFKAENSIGAADEDYKDSA